MDRKVFWFFILGLIMGFGICFFLGLFNVATHPVYLNCVDTANYCIDRYNSFVRISNTGFNSSVFKP